MGVFSLGLASCGGGGGDAAGTSFAFSASLTERLKTTSTVDLVVGGTATYQNTNYPVTGTLQVADMAATSAQFEGKAVSATTENVAGLLYAGGGTWPLSMSVTGEWIGADLVGVVWPDIYCVTAGSGTLPQSIKVGDAGTIATMSCYPDSSKAAQIGRDLVTYAVTKGSTNQSANVTVTASVQDLGGAVLRQTATTYAVTSDGKISIVSFGVQETTNGIAVNVVAK